MEYTKTIGSFFLALLFSGIFPTSFAQQRNNEIFEGGRADGFAVSCFAEKDAMRDGNNRIFEGGKDDGASVSCFAQKDAMRDGNNRIFEGGTADGHSVSCYAEAFPKGQVNSEIFEGGRKDGHSFDCYEQEDDPNPLPIELIVFEMRCKEGDEVLFWKTASEHRNKKFIVQRSADANEYQNVEEVEGAINSVQPNHYAIETKTENPGEYYYRLLMVDLDGKRSYSKPIRGRSCERLKDDWKLDIYPNPANDVLKLDPNFSPERIERLELLSSRGRSVVRIDGFSKEILLTDLEEGVYHLRAITEEKIFQKKVAVEH